MCLVELHTGGDCEGTRCFTIQCVMKGPLTYESSDALALSSAYSSAFAVGWDSRRI